MIVCKTLSYFTFFHNSIRFARGFDRSGRYDVVDLAKGDVRLPGLALGLKTLAATRERSCAGVHSQPPTQRHELGFALWFQ